MKILRKPWSTANYLFEAKQLADYPFFHLLVALFYKYKQNLFAPIYSANISYALSVTDSSGCSGTTDTALFSELSSLTCFSLAGCALERQF